MRSRIQAADLHLALVVDERRRPVRWLSERDLRGNRVPTGEPPDAGLVSVELDDIMRDALGRLLDAEVQYAPVVDAQGAVAGVLSMEVIAHALHVPADQVRSSSELVADPE
jgi:CBS-domain-containing membrane protein